MQEKEIRIALAGNPNVGKSVIFNQLTGMSQVVGNWPGKTVAKAEGSCRFNNYVFRIIDLPGIYSLSTFSLEEIISREYIVEEQPDYIINVVDSNQLERNLFFTLQLKLLNRPIILALNQYDLLKKRGFEIDEQILGESLGVVTQKVIAVHNRGVHELLEKIIEIEEGQRTIPEIPVVFGKEIEQELAEITHDLQKHNFLISQCYPERFVAIKLLEGDEEIREHLQPTPDPKTEAFFYRVDEKQKNLEHLHGEQISTILNAEIYHVVSSIYEKTISLESQTRKNAFRNFVDHLTVHSLWGYVVLAVILLGSYTLIFQFGGWISELLDGLMGGWTPGVTHFLGGEDTWLFKLLWNGMMGGFIAGVGGVLPFVIPFYLLIEILQDIGYLPRAAYLMDRGLHNLGVHGKTIIPMLLGFGCTVPAVSACAIMETEDQRRRSIIISSMIPCSAITYIVLGLVGKHLGIGYALALYFILFVIILAIGRVLTRMSDVDESELIIELHDFRKPNFTVILKQTWHRSKEFVYLALPLIVILGVVMQVFMEFQILDWVNTALSPVTVSFLGLPVGVGIYLLYGVLRKELNLVLLELFVASQGLLMIEYMSPIQMIIFAIVTLLYIPCLATFITIRKEAGKRFAWGLLITRIIGAFLVAGILRWSYELMVIIFPTWSLAWQGLVAVLIFTIVLHRSVPLFAKMANHRWDHSRPHRRGHFRPRHRRPGPRIQKEFVPLSSAKNCSECSSSKCGLHIQLPDEESEEED